MRSAFRIVLAVGCAAYFACCEDQESPSGQATRATTAKAGDSSESVRVERARCPAGAASCASATGTILYVERVDPDGDGDAHFVLLDSESVTAPGITVVDVAAGLRPKPLPGPGDVISAAGPVFPGSYGQRQIEADAVNTAR